MTRMSSRTPMAAVLVVASVLWAGAAAQAGPRPQQSRSPAAYARDGYLPRLLPGSVSPTWKAATVPRTDPTPHDAAGVRLKPASTPPTSSTPPAGSSRRRR
ncbi:hypothetical protein KBX06_22490 [Micromonospora sp. C31]|uniref:hypothetical protein n=1 Tax=Micromonospora sp. C31 TaxID=2824876 RepID=UPI001B37286F|nr:hypothetical protein [Micromonospora sp. C31]MBQ1075905.1 hypothetical protein [Micromonospora sp. C31]